MKKVTIKDILNKKGKEKITMLTCYDYSFAKILDEAGLDIILVGDSLANVLLGMDETRKVSFSEMLNHTKAVAKAVQNSLVVADMPYVAYQKNPKKCVDFAYRLIDAGAAAVKVEWFSYGCLSLSSCCGQSVSPKLPRRNAGIIRLPPQSTPFGLVFGEASLNLNKTKEDCTYVIEKLIKNKIPVMGHIGLTPQTAHLLGGYKVQGKDDKSAEKLIKQASLLEDLGVFSLVLECVPAWLAATVTKKIKIPTIGIGAGINCDGQVLVLYDILGLYKKTHPRFVRVYKDLFTIIKNAVVTYADDVKAKRFPTSKESF